MNPETQFLQSNNTEVEVLTPTPELYDETRSSSASTAYDSSNVSLGSIRGWVGSRSVSPAPINTGRPKTAQHLRPSTENNNLLRPSSAGLLRRPANTLEDVSISSSNSALTTPTNTRRPKTAQYLHPFAKNNRFLRPSSAGPMRRPVKKETVNISEQRESVGANNYENKELINATEQLEVEAKDIVEEEY